MHTHELDLNQYQYPYFENYLERCLRTVNLSRKATVMLVIEAMTV